MEKKVGRQVENVEKGEHKRERVEGKKGDRDGREGGRQGAAVKERGREGG